MSRATDPSEPRTADVPAPGAGPAGRPSGSPRHVYVHAPFCARRCSYCDFAVTVAADPPVAAWAECVGRELAMLAGDRGWGTLDLETLYVGGGTPSLLGVGAIPALLDALTAGAAGRSGASGAAGSGVGASGVERPGVERPGVELAGVELAGVAELTVEANPESFTPELAADWVAAGVDRVSLGAQTFHEPSLRWMGRLHGPEGPARAVRTARGAGLENVGLDLIFGLPERLGRDLDEDLDRILALEPEHISVYGLSVEPDTPLGRWVAEGRETLPDEDRYGEEYLRVTDRLRAAGYHHYEVSNFALPGREARHNAAYWRGVAYLGLGNGAHSYVAPERWWNVRDWPAYRARVERGERPVAESERLDPDAAELERIWLGLRTDRGLDRSRLAPAQAARAADWERDGLAERAGGRVRLTPEGWLLLDRLAVELDAAGTGVA
ncbi:MAG: coproporphyrinogen-III oxidase family protein [Candidatus Longimicrobiales bacterium M2_2A_002]